MRLSHSDGRNCAFAWQVAIAEEGVLFAPGWFFAADQEHDDTDARGEGHFRISFSSAQVRAVHPATAKSECIR